MKHFIILGFSIVVAFVMISAFAVISDKKPISDKHLELMLRDIGHKLLLQANDSSSRVLPIKKLNENLFQISFENEFGFVPDTIINLFQQEFYKNGLPKDYIVNVKKCDQKATIFAFEMRSNGGSLTPCKGRKQKPDCYIVEVEFLKAAKFNFNFLFLLLIPIGLLGFYRKKKPIKELQPNAPEIIKEELEIILEDKNFLQIGSLKFYEQNNTLKVDDKIIPLSEKEAKALLIFATNVNQTIDRDHLMKEIWGDEGIVVISRNVDVLVSKLRKKLSDDSSIKIINIHGKGYKFIIE
jgi:hypothetical protein